MSQYSELMGSFLRTGNYPLEANYIFETEQNLKDFYSDPINASTLHRGLLKIVGSGDNQALYWVVQNGEELSFAKLINKIDIDSIDAQLQELLDKINKEIEDRQNDINDIWGTDNPSTINEQYNSILNLANAVTELLNNVTTNTESINAIAGTDGDIIEYLKTLPYKSLTEVSNTLNKFLNEVDESTTTIDTLPELQKFLDGYSDTDTLKQVLNNIVTSIQGEIPPTTEFSTLKNVEQFVRTLDQWTKDRANNLQSELDQTQAGVGLSGDGSFNPDSTTNYLQSATSVMNALKILDSLIHDTIQEFVLQPSNKDIIPLEITKTNNGYTLGASLTLSSANGNQVTKNSDGLYIKSTLDYQDGQITFKVNDNIISQFNIGISTILNDGYYDPSQEELVLIFNKHDGTQQTVRIPVDSLIREWEPDNTQTKVVELTREEVINGADKLSADVRLSTNAHNILKKDNNTLLVEGTSENIVHNEEQLSTVIENIKSDINLKAPIDNPIFTGIPQVQTSPDAEDSSQRIPSTSWVNQRIQQTAEADLNQHISDYNNPHKVTASQVGAYSKDEVSQLLSTKADLVDGVVPDSQLPPFRLYWIDVE